MNLITKEVHKLSSFIEIRNFFRRYTTRETRKRVRDLVGISKKLNSQGFTIAFDVVGSVNFGMSSRESDIDIVIYNLCNPKEPQRCSFSYCPKARVISDIVLKIWIEEYNEDPYPIELVDCVSLEAIENDIAMKNYKSMHIQKFVFFRLIGFPINYGLLRRYEERIVSNKEFLKKILSSIWDFLDFYTKTSAGVYSINKYIGRLVEKGIKLPPYVKKSIEEYLGK